MHDGCTVGWSVGKLVGKKIGCSVGGIVGSPVGYGQLVALFNAACPIVLWILASHITQTRLVPWKAFASTSTKLFSICKYFIDWQFLNAPLDTFPNQKGKYKFPLVDEPILVQPWKALTPMLLNPSGKLTLSKRLHPWNDDSPILNNPVGKETCIKLIQLSKVKLDNDINEEGNCTLCNDLQFWNACSPISLTLSVILRSGPKLWQS